jgi:hypothetical protein
MGTSGRAVENKVRMVMLAICSCSGIRKGLSLHMCLFVTTSTVTLCLRSREIVRSIKRQFPTQDKLPADSANLHGNAPDRPVILVISTCISRFFDICNRTRLGFGQRLLAMMAKLLQGPP